MEQLVISIPKNGLVNIETEELSDHINLIIQHQKPSTINTRWESTQDSPDVTPMISPINISSRSSPLGSFGSPMNLTSALSSKIMTSSPVVNNSPIRMSPLRSPPISSTKVSPFMDKSIITRSPVISPNRMSPVRTSIMSPPRMSPLSSMVSQSPSQGFAIMSNPINTCTGFPIIVDFEPNNFIDDVNAWKSLMEQFGIIVTIEIKSSVDHDNLLVVFNDIESTEFAYNNLNNTYLDTSTGPVLVRVLL